MTAPASSRPKSIGLAPGLDDAAAGQDAAKYGTSNPVVQKLLARWMTTMHAVLGDTSGVVVDIGIGEGFALERMFPANTPAIGLEYRHDKALVASRSCPPCRWCAAMPACCPSRTARPTW